MASGKEVNLIALTDAIRVFEHFGDGGAVNADLFFTRFLTRHRRATRAIPGSAVAGNPPTNAVVGDVQSGGTSHARIPPICVPCLT